MYHTHYNYTTLEILVFILRAFLRFRNLCLFILVRLRLIVLIVRTPLMKRGDEARLNIGRTPADNIEVELI